MKCPDCGARLRVYRTYHLSATQTRHYRKCEGCGIKYVSDETLQKRSNGADRGEVIELLTKWGVFEEQARRMVSSWPVQTIRAYSHNLPTIMLDYEATRGTPVHDQAGFLVWAINTDYPLPGDKNGQDKLQDGEILYYQDLAGELVMTGF